MSDTDLEPADLAREFGVTGMRIRGFLRERYPDEAPGKGGRWALRAEQVAAVRAYFGRPRSARSEAPRATAPAIGGATYHDLWYWEGNVQAAIATHLARDGWQIISVADTAHKARGDDILARRDGTTLRVEVKGWPSEGVYADERRAGETKHTPPSLQAAHWYSQAILRAMRLLHSYPRDLVAIGLPDTDRFRSLVEATRTPLERLGVGVYLVRDGNEVGAYLPCAPE